MEAGNLTDAQQLAVDKAIFDSVKLLHIVYHHPACFGHKVLDESTGGYG